MYLFYSNISSILLELKTSSSDISSYFFVSWKFLRICKPSGSLSISSSIFFTCSTRAGSISDLWETTCLGTSGVLSITFNSPLTDSGRASNSTLLIAPMSAFFLFIHQGIFTSSSLKTYVILFPPANRLTLKPFCIRYALGSI